MSSFILLLAIGALQTAKMDPGSEAAINAFREACIQGSLKLSPARGRVLRNNETTSFVDVIDWNRAKMRRTVVKLNTPSSTYLVFAEYKSVQPKSIAATCSLVSGYLSKEDAAAAFLEGLPPYEPRPRWVPNMYFPVWTADHPELGYRKRLRFRNDGSIVLEVGMYPAGEPRLRSEQPKQ